ncbi:MAG TPA: pyruvate kinase [Blastocatellia bacterium]|nr:pyruvate kinase [Blastocatellia bacterium]
MRRAKIVATIGPASESEDRLRALMLAGMDVARINMSHGDRTHHGEVIARIRRVSQDLRRPVAVLLDISGPKIRTGKLRGGSVELKDGEQVRITSEPVEGDSTRFTSNYARLSSEVESGGRILLDDGQLELRVVETSGTDVLAVVVHGGILGEHKGINLPGAKLSLPSVTAKDEGDLKFGIAAGIDLVALSFVRSAEDCRHARGLIGALGSDVPLIAKIEKPEAVENFTAILEETEGVMVARGDLAVETSTEKVPVIQKRIIAETLRAGKVAITATQMLQSMIENPRPTRAEASDVANAVLDGSDAVMLSGESAIGKYPVESVATMNRIVCSAEQIPSDLAADSQYQMRSGSEGRAIAEAASYAARELSARLIVVVTRSGEMARLIAALRPEQRIIALTPLESTRVRLAVRWGVEPYRLTGGRSEDSSRSERDSEDDHPDASNPISESMPENLLAVVEQKLLGEKLAEPGETVIVMAGEMSDPSIANSMRLRRIGC